MAYLDIETTTIALYNGESIYHYVNNHNLDDFLDDINKYKVIVTYNGKSFDVPFIDNYFGIELNHAHILTCVIFSVAWAIRAVLRLAKLN